jgi:hypothetical protein
MEIGADAMGLLRVWKFSGTAQLIPHYVQEEMAANIASTYRSLEIMVAYIHVLSAIKLVSKCEDISSIFLQICATGSHIW